MEMQQNNSFRRPNTANKPFRSPNQRFQNRNGPNQPVRPMNKNFQNRPFNPQQNRPFNPQQNRNGPFNPQQNRPFNPQQNRPFNPQQNRPFNPQQNRPPFNPQQNRPFNPQQNRPFNPQQNRPPFNPQQNRPFKPQQNRPFNPNQQQNRPFNPNQNRPFNKSSQQNRSFNKGPHQNRPFNKSPQQGRQFNKSPHQNRPFNKNPHHNNRQNKPPPSASQENGSNAQKRIMNKTQGVKRKAAPDTRKPINEKRIKIDTPEKRRRTLFVGNVPLDTTEKDIKDLFKKYGTIESIRFRGIPRADLRESRKVAIIKKNFHNKRKAMLCYVAFVNKDDADKAKEMNGKTLNNHVLRVNLADTEPPLTDNLSIFVGNLALNAEDNELIEAFKDCGPIHSVRISRDSITQMGRGFGYVNFTTTDAVELALQMENVTIKNRKLRIKRSDGKKLDESSKKWFSVKIANVPDHVKRAQIERAFERCGKIVNITFQTTSQKLKTKAVYVAFDTPQTADNALKLRFNFKNKDYYLRKDPFNPYTRIFLRNVPTTTKKADVQTGLQDCGKIKSTLLLLKPKLPYTTGFGVVEFDSVEAAEKALKLKSFKVKDQIIDIGKYMKYSYKDDPSSEDDSDSLDEVKVKENGENESDSDSYISDVDDEIEQDEDNDEDDDVKSEEDSDDEEEDEDVKQEGSDVAEDSDDDDNDDDDDDEEEDNDVDNNEEQDDDDDDDDKEDADDNEDDDDDDDEDEDDDDDDDDE